MAGIDPIADVGIEWHRDRMSVAQPTVIETVTRTDGRRQWRLYRRSDGLFEYREFVWDSETYWIEVHGGEAEIAALDKWLPNSGSGYFDTPEKARSDARAAIDWLSESP